MISPRSHHSLVPGRTPSVSESARDADLVERYTAYADECQRIAYSTTDRETREGFLNLAVHWGDLAKRVARKSHD